jgi:DNA-binding MarR family transcriptional regulator
LLWSNSRLSHHIARMEQRGLVTRTPSPDDGRGSVVALTPAGRAAITEAAPKHVASVREHFIDLLSEADLKTLADLTERVVANLRP